MLAVGGTVQNIRGPKVKRWLLEELSRDRITGIRAVYVAPLRLIPGDSEAKTGSPRVHIALIAIMLIAIRSYRRCQQQ
jgi:hypothetical protein